MQQDVIDNKLAEFINNYPDRSKLKIMFMREAQGVYQFGSKRIAVKVEKDSIIIRVGGGYLSIDEFLDQYTPLELEKVDKKDPLNQFAEKLAVHKSIEGREVSPLGRASARKSPISGRTLAKSPLSLGRNSRGSRGMLSPKGSRGLLSPKSRVAY